MTLCPPLYIDNENDSEINRRLNKYLSKFPNWSYEEKLQLFLPKFIIVNAKSQSNNSNISDMVNRKIVYYKTIGRNLDDYQYEVSHNGDHFIVLKFKPFDIKLLKFVKNSNIKEMITDFIYNENKQWLYKS